MRVHVGLGDAASADLIEVKWPDGRFDMFRDVKANQLVTHPRGRADQVERQRRRSLADLFGARTDR